MRRSRDGDGISNLEVPPMAVDAPAIDMDKLNALMGQLVGELGATVNAGLIVLGDRLGLYRAMAGAGYPPPRDHNRRVMRTRGAAVSWKRAGVSSEAKRSTLPRRR